MNKKNLLKIVEKFRSKKIIVIGDVMLDEYIFGEIKGISPEAPVPLVKARETRYFPGGAGNASMNLASLGVKTYVAGVRGFDVDGDILSGLFKRNRINDECVIQGRNPTTLKTRIVCQGQQLLRYDNEKPEPIDKNTSFHILDFVKKRIRNIDGILISDYDKGVCGKELMEEIIRLCSKHKKPVVVDSKAADPSKYRFATLFTPNLHDARQMCGFQHPGRIAYHLMEMLSSNILITMGEEGVKVCEINNMPYDVPTRKLDRCDPTGAGDTVSAVALLALCSGADISEVAEISQAAARLVIQKIGTANVNLKELKDEVNNI